MFHNWNKTEWIHRLILLILPLLFVALMLSQNDIYGSLTDWLSQHITFPDYFRMIFQETGQLFPDFSLNLGGGQNFAQYTYYGLLRPDVLISFFLPGIAMRDIIVTASICYMLLSIQLFYQWMKTKVKTPWILLFVSCLFALSGPLLFHSHRHIMFISYFPGLLLCLIGTDHYLERKKTFLLVTGVFFMIITSYFFSVAGLVVTGIYSIYAWMKRYPQGTWKAFFIYILKYIGWLLAGVLVSCFYLIPTAYAMLLQTRPALEHPSLAALFIPKTGFSAMLYDDYNIGLTAISIAAVVYGFVKKNKAGRLLSLFLLLIICIPLCQYVLSGMQYVRAKSLIPFLPLAVMLIGIMLEDWQHSEKKFPWWILIICLLQAFGLKSNRLKELFAADILLMLLLFLILRKTQWKKYFIVYLIVPAFVCMQLNVKEDFVTNTAMKKVTSATKTKLISKTLDTYPGLYRLDDASTSYSVNRVEDIRQFKTTQYSSNSNIDYNEFYYTIMKQPMLNRNHVIMSSVENPYFSGFMGVRFLYDQGKGKPNRYGYHTVLKKKTKFIEENENVMPLAYVSYDKISRRQFDSYSYPYSIEALYMNTVVEDDLPDVSFYQSVHKVKPSFTLSDISDNVKIEKVKKGMRIKSEGKGRMKLSLKEPLLANQLLIIRSNIADIEQGNSRDTTVAINRIHNKKTATSAVYASSKADFEYVIGDTNGLHDLTFEFTKGSYTLENFEFYISDASLMKARKAAVTEMKVKNTDGSLLSGNVNARDDGVFVTSIPYQKGLQIYIDGQKAAAKKVNTAFLGADIKQGNHLIEIRYTMPGKALGIFVSGGALAVLVIIWGWNRKKSWKLGKK